MKRIFENIGNTSRRVQAGNSLDDWPYRSGKAALEEKVSDGLVLMTEHTRFASMPVTPSKIVFG
jgi:hypothetical protein